MSLLSLAFWFNLRPGSMPANYKNFLIGLVIVLIVSSVIFFVLKKRKGFYKKALITLYDFSISNAFIALLLLFFNYELVPFFSARFWFLIWLISSILWLFYILKALKQIPKKIKQSVVKDEIKKYLP